VPLPLSRDALPRGAPRAWVGLRPSASQHLASSPRQRPKVLGGTSGAAHSPEAPLLRTPCSSPVPRSVGGQRGASRHGSLHEASSSRGSSNVHHWGAAASSFPPHPLHRPTGPGSSRGCAVPPSHGPSKATHAGTRGAQPAQQLAEQGGGGSASSCCAVGGNSVNGTLHGTRSVLTPSRGSGACRGLSLDTVAGRGSGARGGLSVQSRALGSRAGVRASGNGYAGPYPRPVSAPGPLQETAGTTGPQFHQRQLTEEDWLPHKCGQPGSKLKLFSGTSNKGLAQEIAACIGLELGKIEIKRFADGEIYVQVQESVRGATCSSFR